MRYSLRNGNQIELAAMNGHTDSFYKDLMIIGVIHRSDMMINGRHFKLLKLKYLPPYKSSVNGVKINMNNDYDVSFDLIASNKSVSDLVLELADSGLYHHMLAHAKLLKELAIFLVIWGIKTL